MQFAIENGIVSSEALQQEIDLKRKEQVLEIHKQAISRLSDGRWQTHYYDSDGKRKELRAATRDKLLDKLIRIYNIESYNKNLTLNDIYPLWLNYKRDITTSPNTIVRHDEHYRRYFKDSALFNTCIADIDVMMLRSSCNQLIKTFNLTKHEWVNIKTIISSIFDYAFEKNIISVNPVLGLKISVKYRQAAHKNSADEVFNQDERAAIIKWLYDRFETTKDIRCLGLIFNFFVGLRIGELVALKWSDINNDTLTVQREEITNKETRTKEIVNHTKTYNVRSIPLVSEATRLLSLIKDNSDSTEFIFSSDNVRFSARQFEYILERYAKENNCPMKSSHKIRKTFASMLEAAGMPLKEISVLLGHSEVITTTKYLFNPLTSDSTCALMEQAL